MRVQSQLKARAVLTAVRSFLPYFVGFNAAAVAAASVASAAEQRQCLCRYRSHSLSQRRKQRVKEYIGTRAQI